MDVASDSDRLPLNTHTIVVVQELHRLHRLFYISLNLFRFHRSDDATMTCIYPIQFHNAVGFPCEYQDHCGDAAQKVQDFVEELIPSNRRHCESRGG